MASNTDIINKQLLEMGSYISQKDVQNPKVSKVPVSWHISHILKVLNAVYLAMKDSNPADYKSEFSMPKTIVFLTGKIPRGKAKAPKNVLPPDIIEIRDLEKQLHQAKQNIFSFENLDDKANFPHPYFKQLNKKETLKFLRIHNEHHLKIVRDILKPVEAKSAGTLNH